MSLSRDDLQRLRLATEQVTEWSNHARAILDHRAQVTAGADAAFRALSARIVQVTVRNGNQWAALPLRQADEALLGLLSRRGALPTIRASDATWLNQLSSDVPQALIHTKSNFGLRKLFKSRESRELAERWGQYLLDYQVWGVKSGVTAMLTRLDDRDRGAEPVDTARALLPQIGLAQRLASLGPGELLPRESVTALPAAVGSIMEALDREANYRQKAM